MKIKAELFLINNRFDFQKKIFIAGSDESYVGLVRDFVVNKYKENNFYIDISGEINENMGGNLFSNNKVVFLVNEASSKKDLLKIYEGTEQNLILLSTNSRHISALKSNLSKLKEWLIIDCYALNRSGKEIVVKNFLEKNNLKPPNNIFWFIVENFENNYALLINQLNLLSLMSGDLSSTTNIERIIYGENNIQINKIFFYIFKDNKFLTDMFRKNFFSQNDFYIFLNSLKMYLDIVAFSPTQESAVSKFPKYLFNEKGVFLRIYKSLNQKKIKFIYNNIYKAEKLIRKNPSMSSEIGLRFLLSMKKIITS